MRDWFNRIQINRLLASFNIWWRKSRVSAAELRATVWKREAIGILRELNLHEKRIKEENESFAKRFADTTEELNGIKANTEQQIRLVEKRLDYANQLIERHDEVEEGLSAELKILKEVVIPELTLANESVRSQMEADIALQAQRQAAYLPSRTRTSEV